jgi:hypothetical protein
MTMTAAPSHTLRALGVATFDMSQRYVSRTDLRQTLDNLERGLPCVEASE